VTDPVGVGVRVAGSIAELGIDRGAWNALALASPAPSPYLTWEFQRAWDEVLGTTEPLFVAAERDGDVVAVAALRVDGGDVTFGGTCFEFDRLDVLGDASDPDLLTGLLSAARDHVGDFGRFDLEFVHSGSPTHDELPAVAERLGLTSEIQYEMVGLETDFRANRGIVEERTSRQVLKDERWFARHGKLDVHHLRDAAEILPRLPPLFDQHRRRRPGPDDPSRFHRPKIVRLFERITENCIGTDLLRFTQVEWDGRPIACHFGIALAGRTFLKLMSFEPELASRGPGSVLLRHVLAAARDEGCDAYDFGTGPQDFKRRYATRSWPVLSWLLEEPE
jgi:CelD/BcsL family acetyltransferase involved in cellulose biosynthesis